MANQKRNRLLALALALCLALGMLLPAGQVNAEGRSAGILTEVTGQEREQLASLADDTLAGCSLSCRVKAPWSRAMPPLPWRRRPPIPAVS